jgi:hypothetical protein
MHCTLTDVHKQTALNHGHTTFVCWREVVVWHTELVRGVQMVLNCGMPDLRGLACTVQLNG